MSMNISDTFLKAIQICLVILFIVAMFFFWDNLRVIVICSLIFISVTITVQLKLQRIRDMKLKEESMKKKSG